MNIVINDEDMSRIISEEFIKTRTRTMYGDSTLEKAIKQAVHEIVKDRIKEMIKANPSLMDELKKSLVENIANQMSMFGERVAKVICRSVEEGMEAEFRTYE